MPRRKLTDLSKLSRSELKSLADRALQMMRDKEHQFVDAVKAQAHELGIELSELITRLSGTPPRRGRPPRVIVDSGTPAGSPTDGRRKKHRMKGKKVKPWFALEGQTWTGRGNPARFIKEYVQGGGKLADILVDKTKADEAKRIEAKIKGQSGVLKKKTTGKKMRSKGNSKKGMRNKVTAAS